MHHKMIPGERCAHCKRHNQIVYNVREVRTSSSTQRKRFCDQCHALAMDTPKQPEKVFVHGTTFIATEENLRRLWKLIS